MVRTMRSGLLTCAVASWVLASTSVADVPCTVTEKGFERFDTKKSAWVETSEVVLMRCGAAIRLEYRQAGKLVDSVVVPSPQGKQTWALDGLACGEKGQSVARQHAVLFERFEKPIAVWAVNSRTHQWEALDLKNVTCSKDEP